MPFDALSKSHPGQRRASARKKRNRIEKRRQRDVQLLHMRLRSENDVQALQDCVECSFSVRGIAQQGEALWKSLFCISSVEVNQVYRQYFGDTHISLYQLVRVMADLGRVSFEREALSHLLTRGFTLEELVVESLNKDPATWGICAWVKDHPSYQSSIPALRGLEDAVFRTESGQECHLGLLSSQMYGGALLRGSTSILLHKMLVYHKIVLSPPQGWLPK